MKIKTEISLYEQKQYDRYMGRYSIQGLEEDLHQFITKRIDTHTKQQIFNLIWNDENYNLGLPIDENFKNTLISVTIHNAVRFYNRFGDINSLPKLKGIPF
tara:strand:- start:42 stop:344 length:303 start_codon:yes stop_codon:yes gene_type:complete